MFLFCLILTSCDKEEKISLSSDKLTERNGSLVTSLAGFNSSEIKHQKIAILLSKYLADTTVWSNFKTKTNYGSTAVLLSDYFYNDILSNATLRTKLEQKVLAESSFFDSGDLLSINSYLAEFPGIEIAILDDSENNTVVNSSTFSNFEVVCVYSDSDTYPRFQNGLNLGNYTAADSPTDKIIVKLIIDDHYFVYNNNTVRSSTKYQDIINSCGDVSLFLRNQIAKSLTSKSITTRTFNNPLGGYKVIENKAIAHTFNENCNAVPPIPPTSPVPPYVVDPCPDGIRNTIVNKKEKVVEVRGNGSESWLRDCDKWCSYWNEDCVIQVDLFIPVISNEDVTKYKVLNSQMKLMTLNEKRLRKGWFLNPGTEFTEWLFLEGKHGDEWQYTFTGRHRKRGTTSEFTVQSGFSSKISFKIGSVGVEVSPALNITNKISRANKDCELGNDIARYCRLTFPEKISNGTMDLNLTEAW